MAGIDSLSEYARRFHTVEVDQWFWALPEAPIAAQYAAVTPDDFRFTIKLPNMLTLTHQFEYLNGQKMESLQAFLGFLERFFAAAPRPLPVGVEIRNPYWLNRRYFEFLSARGLSPVFLQGSFMPPIFDTWKKFGFLVKEPVPVRLHGPDRDGMGQQTGERWDRVVTPGAPLTIGRLKERGILDEPAPRGAR